MTATPLAAATLVIDIAVVADAPTLTSGGIFTGLEDAALALHAIVAGLDARPCGQVGEAPVPAMLPRKAAEIAQAEAEGAEPKAMLR